MQFTSVLSFLNYSFMQNALFTIILIAPIFALLGVIVLNNRLVFFSDCIGHSGLAGVAIGMLLGLSPTFAMLILAVLIAIVVTLLKYRTKSSQDTVLGVILASITALGIVLLSNGGNFSKFTSYLIGDILAISLTQIIYLVIIGILVIIYSIFFTNSLVLISIDPLLAKSKHISVYLCEISFTIVLAIIIVLTLKFIGILVISSLLILPPATAKILANNFRQSIIFAIAISLFSGILGLMLSYYLGTATGATIVIINSIFYLLAIIIKNLKFQ